MNYTRHELFTHKSLPSVSPQEVLDAYGIKDDALGPGNAAGKLLFMFEREHYEATHDELTGVANRQGFSEHIEKNGLPKVLLVLDGDGMKAINDTLGHNRGDDFIVDTSKIATDSIRSQDFVARIGGDEFVIALYDEPEKTGEAKPPMPPSEVAKIVADRIKTKAQELLAAPENADLRRAGIDFGISVGSAAWQEGIDITQMLENADDSMYLDKHLNKNKLETV